MTDAEINELLARLLPELEEMANHCSVDFELWNRFSNSVIKADAIIRQLRASHVPQITKQQLDLVKTLKYSNEPLTEALSALIAMADSIVSST